MGREKNDEGVKCSVCGSHSCENFAQAQQIEGAAHALSSDAFFSPVILHLCIKANSPRLKDISVSDSISAYFCKFKGFLSLKYNY